MSFIGTPRISQKGISGALGLPQTPEHQPVHVTLHVPAQPTGRRASGWVQRSTGTAIAHFDLGYSG